jgi:beta-N-acetylhexosaminidase
MIEDVSWLLASELLEVGIDLSLSPVVDLKKFNRAIGDRAFHSSHWPMG